MKTQILKVLPVFLLFASIVFAQAPEGFNYQGVVRDNGSLLPSTAITVRASIEQGTPGGSVVYSETHSLTTNAFGVFNMTIGNGTPTSGTFGLIPWGSNTHYLNIDIDFGTGSLDMGSTQLVSVPYALHAKNGSQWSDASSGIYYESGKVGIGTTFPMASLHVDSTIGISRGGQYFSMGVTSGGELGFYPNSIGATGSPLLWLEDSPARVGIGTSSPQDVLHVAGGGVFIEDTTSTPAERTLYGNSMPFAYGVVTGGTIITDYGVSSASVPSTGTYEVVLDRAFTGVPVVIVTSMSQIPKREIVTYDYSGNNTIIIHIVDETGAGVQTWFSFVVFANP